MSAAHVQRLSVWQEIQAALRGPHAIPRGESERVTFDIVNGCGQRVTSIVDERASGCALCSCPHDVHSTVLPFAPCLDCDCIGWTVRRRPDPIRRGR